MLQLFQRFLLGFFAVQPAIQLLTADGLRGGSGQALFPGSFYLLSQPHLHHFILPPVNASIQRFPVVIAQPQLNDMIGTWLPQAFGFVFPDGLSADRHHLNGPNDPAHIIGVDTLGRFRVHCFQPPPQGIIALPLRQLPQPLPQRFIAGDCLAVLHIVHNGLDIKSRTAAQHRHLAPA